MMPHEDLIGYLLGALDPPEQAQVEAALRSDPKLRDELQRLKASLLPLESERESFDPPPGLADRTVQFVERQRVIPREQYARSKRFRALDAFATVAAIVAIALLVFPALFESRFHARVSACQNHLRQIGTQLVSYADLQPDRSYPPLVNEGHLAFVGRSAVELRERQFLPADARIMICPGDDRLTQHWGGIPTTQELLRATGQQLRMLQRQAGGSYGWSLGVIDKGRFRAPQHRGSEFFVILSDAPSPGEPHLASRNHGGVGWNVLYDDLHCQFIKVGEVERTPDDPLRNHLGLVAAGVGGNDSVVAPSETPVRVITTIMLQNTTPARPDERMELRR